MADAFQYQLMPDLTTEEYEALKHDIAARGVQVPIEYDEKGGILDGHHRLRACQELGIRDWPRVVRVGVTEDQKREHVLALNLARRHLSKEQRQELVGRLRAGGWSIPRIAERLQTSVGTVHADLKAFRTESLPTKVTGADGKSYPAQQQERIKPISLFNPTSTDVKAARQIQSEAPRLAEAIASQELTLDQAKRQIAREERIGRLVEISEGNQPLSTGRRYNVILADPPWRYEHTISDSRAIEQHYPTMTDEEIAELPVDAISADNAVLFLWVTTPMLKRGLAIMSAWGFEYRTSMVWVKPSIGPGYWVRQRHEYLLIGVRGDIPTPAAKDKPDSVIEAPRTDHSRKPEIVHQIIERMYPQLSRIELFARGERVGWNVWGNQAGQTLETISPTLTRQGYS